MNKILDPHRKVKIDYSVLRELLSIYEHYDGTYIWDMYDETPSLSRFNKDIIKKAKNIIYNS